MPQVVNIECCFCKSSDVSLLYKQKYHKVKRNHGPVNFYKCNTCFSGFTFPLPSPQQLKELYDSFEGGMDNFTRQIRNKNPLTKWFQNCISEALKYSHTSYNTNDSFTWIDIGAGDGELVKLMSQKFPNAKGIAVDFHKRPENLKDCTNITWIQCDLNEPDYYKKISISNFDIVFCITVLEHILKPYNFLDNLIKILGNGKILYLTTPDFGSVTAKLLSSRWPYLTFGEHLNIPSKKGMKILLQTLVKENNLEYKKQIFVAPTVLPYPLNYFLQYYRFNFLSKFFSNEITFNFPTGILKSGLITK
ncbi:MAG: class I SAM-dependent methyltransferase [Chitinophagaceae bacterium]